MIDCRSHGNEWSGSTPGNEQAMPAILSGIGIRPSPVVVTSPYRSLTSGQNA
jgi:hypothetical protein